MLFSPEVIQKLLEKNKCSLTRTGKSLGVSPQYVHQLMEAHGVQIQKTAVIREDRKGLKAKAS